MQELSDVPCGRAVHSLFFSSSSSSSSSSWRPYEQSQDECSNAPNGWKPDRLISDEWGSSFYCVAHACTTPARRCLNSEHDWHPHRTGDTDQLHRTLSNSVSTLSSAYFPPSFGLAVYCQPVSLSTLPFAFFSSSLSFFHSFPPTLAAIHSPTLVSSHNDQLITVLLHL